MAERFNAGWVLLALGAIVLLVSLFLSWYEPSLTAWTVFEIVDLLLAAIAVAALFGVVADAAPATRLPRQPRGAGLGLALAALVLVFVALVNHPPAAIGRGLELGAWLGLAGAAVMVAGALLGLGRVSVVITRSPGGARRATPPEPAAAAEPTRPLGYEERPGAEAETRSMPRRG
jgi:peptidoglycan/LPS O-acetylase OafA/YrhL